MIAFNTQPISSLLRATLHDLRGAWWYGSGVCERGDARLFGDFEAPALFFGGIVSRLLRTQRRAGKKQVLCRTAAPSAIRRAINRSIKRGACTAVALLGRFSAAKLKLTDRDESLIMRPEAFFW